MCLCFALKNAKAARGKKKIPVEPKILQEKEGKMKEISSRTRVMRTSKNAANLHLILSGQELKVARGM